MSAKRPRTFDLREGCPFQGDATFPGCLHWPVCVASSPSRPSWYTPDSDRFVPDLLIDFPPLAACTDFQPQVTP